MRGLAEGLRHHYLAAMPLPRPSSPRALWADLRLFWSGRSRTQWVAALFAIMIPIGILGAFYLDAKTNIAPGPQLIFVESWPVTRTDAEIREKQQRDRVAREARERERQRQFQEIDNGLRRYGI
jgi:hypothetical protein